MRILIVGAGATGGALGARLLQAGRDVTFLVRTTRAEQLATAGLRFSAPDGETTHPVHAVTDLTGSDPYDLVIIALKAPALSAVIPSLGPVIGAHTRIVPLLNGMAHIDVLEQAFPGRVLAGIMQIVGTVNADGTVLQLTGLCTLAVGNLRGTEVPAEVSDALGVPGVELSVLEDGETRLWEKWAFIAAAGVVTCLFRGSIGQIMAAGGRTQVLAAIDECEQVAHASGYPVDQAWHQSTVEMLTAPVSGFTSSLYRDLLHGEPLEAEHILGNLAARAAELSLPTPLLDATVLQLRTHRQLRLEAGA